MRRFSSLILAIGLASLAVTSQAHDFVKCQNQFPGGIVPKSTSDTVQDLCKFADGKPIFAIRFDATRKIPTWTAHKLTPQDANHQTKRNRPQFFPDPNVKPTDQAINKSYTRSGFSRGHMIPAADMSWNAQAFRATFNFTNVVPQKQRFNAGKWLGMENKLRTHVKNKNIDIWDFSGVYGQVQTKPTLGKAPHDPVVPKCFYKIFVAKANTGPEYKVLAALFHWNDDGKRKTWNQAITSLARIKARTGIDFGQGLGVETPFDPNFWGVPMPENKGDCP